MADAVAEALLAEALAEALLAEPLAEALLEPLDEHPTRANAATMMPSAARTRYFLTFISPSPFRLFPSLRFCARHTIA